MATEDSPQDRTPKPALRRYRAIAQEIGTAIVSGELLPHTALPGEVEQSRRLGISRTMYREAIGILSAKGLIESKPNAGTRVAAKTEWYLLDPDVLDWMALSGKVDPQFLHELFELRNLIEPAAAGFAAMRRSAIHIERMRSALMIMRARGLGSQEGREADQLFHSIILEAAGNTPLASLTSTISASLAWTTRLSAQGSKKPRDLIVEHLAVFEAIESARPERAREAMIALLASSQQDLDITDKS